MGDKSKRPSPTPSLTTNTRQKKEEESSKEKRKCRTTLSEIEFKWKEEIFELVQAGIDKADILFPRSYSVSFFFPSSSTYFEV